MNCFLLKKISFLLFMIMFFCLSLGSCKKLDPGESTKNTYHIYLPSSLFIMDRSPVFWGEKKVSNLIFVKYHKETKNNEYTFKIDIKEIHKRKENIYCLFLIGNGNENNEEQYSKIVVNREDSGTLIRHKVWLRETSVFFKDPDIIQRKLLKKKQNRRSRKDSFVQSEKNIQLINAFREIQDQTIISYLEEEDFGYAEVKNRDGSRFTPEQYFDVFPDLWLREGKYLVNVYFMGINITIMNTVSSFEDKKFLVEDFKNEMEDYPANRKEYRNYEPDDYLNDIFFEKTENGYLGMALVKYYGNNIHTIGNLRVVTSSQEVFDSVENSLGDLYGPLFYLKVLTANYKPEVIEMEDYVLVKLSEFCIWGGLERVTITIPKADPYNMRKVERTIAYHFPPYMM